MIGRAKRALIAAFVTFSALCLQVLGSEGGLWKIGKVDNSTLEFNDKWDFASGRDPEFVTGTSDTRKDWSGFQPGSRDRAHGSRPHPFTVLFELRDQPVGVFYLTINLLFKSAGVPQYVVEVNGHKGRFFPNPRLSEEIGDPETAWNIIFSNYRLNLALPASFFRAGSNRLVLTCLDDNSAPILGSVSAVSAESGVYYDALQLSNDPQGKPANTLDAGATPTMFYRHGESGLREIVLLKASGSQPLRGVRASLTVAGKPYSCRVDSEYEFGEVACAVDVAEFQGAVPAQLVIHAGRNGIAKNLQLTAARKWKLFLAPQMHLDMGYTDYRPNSYEVHARNIDEITATLEKHKDYKFNPDGAFIYSDYWRNRKPELLERVLQLVREKRLTLPAQLFTINTGLASQEELFRLFYTSAEFARANRLPITYANQTDVPAHVWPLPSYLQAIGIRYFAISSNPFRGAIIPNGRVNALSPFWWEGPDGARVLTWFSRQYQQFEGLFTKGNSVAAGLNSLPIFLQTYSTPEYVPDAVLVYGTQSDNRPFLASELDFSEQWNREFAYPSLQLATIDEFFGYIERAYGTSLKTLRGDGGAWWEEMAASNAQFAALARRTKQRAVAAEKIASLASVVNPDIPFPLALDGQIWQNLLFYTEHTWGAAGTWRRPQSDEAIILRRDKEAFSVHADQDVDDMLHRGLSQFGDKLNLRGPAVLVFNTLSWARSGEVEVDLDRGHGLVDPETGKTVELEIVRRVPDEQYDRVRFRVSNIPPVGYRCYSIVPRASVTQDRDLESSHTIENQYYRVVVDPQRGGIVSIYDKSLGKELVDANGPYALDQYVYAGYGHDGHSLIEQRARLNSSLLQISPALPDANLAVSKSGHGKVTSVQQTPWGAKLTMTSAAVHTPAIRTEIRLFDQEKKIRIWNHVNKEAVESPEGVYLAFPFAVNPPKINYESQNTWIDPEKDQLPGANKEWFAAQNWVSVSAPDLSIGLTLDEAPLFTVGDIDRGLWPKTLSLRGGTLFSYIMNNYDGDDERPFQAGELDFHYSITSGSTFQPEQLVRFAREETCPLEVDVVNEADKLVWREEPLPAASGTFIDIDNPQVILSTWKGAEDGRGAILRFYNTGVSSTQARVKFPQLQFKEAYWTSGTENDQGAVGSMGEELIVPLKAHEIRTVRVLGFSLRRP